ncbi:SPFH domain-containing protein [[Eubacterium] cellulosolvens]
MVVLWISLLEIVVIALLISTGIKKIQPNEEGLLIVLGNYRRKLSPGRHFVPPLISKVVRFSMLPQTVEISKARAASKDQYFFDVNGKITFKVVDSQKAYFEVQNYQAGILLLTQKVLKTIIGKMDHQEVLRNLNKYESKLKRLVNRESKAWGVQIEEITFHNVEQVFKGKDAETIASKRKFEMKLRKLIGKFAERFGVEVEELEIRKVGIGE